jgi:cysteine desulfurase family protein (TIGR01976 family)
MLNVHAIREQFPALQRTLNGHPVIYADNPGGTQVPRSVADAMSDYLLNRNANVHGGFVTSQLTDETVNEARMAMADLLNAPSPDEIVFGANMTSLTFQMMHALARNIQPGDEVIVTVLDHDANYTPWITLAQFGATVHQVKLNREDVTLNLDDFQRYLSPNTRVVAFGHASNAVGTINPAQRLVEMVRAAAPQALIYIDAVQSVPHIPVDVQALGCDFLACSSYKFFGPHMGILWGRYEVLDSLLAYKVRPAPPNPPDKFESGTKNHEGMAGVTAAVNYLASLGANGAGSRRDQLRQAMEAIQEHEQGLSYRLIRGLTAMPGVHFYGIQDVERLDERVPTVAINLEGQVPQIVANTLAQRGIFCWAGHYYALEVIEELGLVPDGAVRLGLTHYNTEEEVDRILETLDGLRLA